MVSSNCPRYETCEAKRMYAQLFGDGPIEAFESIKYVSDLTKTMFCGKEQGYLKCAVFKSHLSQGESEADADLPSGGEQ